LKIFCVNIKLYGDSFTFDTSTEKFLSSDKTQSLTFTQIFKVLPLSKFIGVAVLNSFQTMLNLLSSTHPVEQANE
jgi:hypothetical protein